MTTPTQERITAYQSTFQNIWADTSRTTSERLKHSQRLNKDYADVVAYLEGLKRQNEEEKHAVAVSKTKPVAAKPYYNYRYQNDPEKQWLEKKKKQPHLTPVVIAYPRVMFMKVSIQFMQLINQRISLMSRRTDCYAVMMQVLSHLSDESPFCTIAPSQIALNLGIPRSKVSEALRQLHEAGLIQKRREGNTMKIAVDPLDAWGGTQEKGQDAKTLYEHFTKHDR